MKEQEFEAAKKVLFDVGKEINEETRMSKNAKSFAVAIILNKINEIQQLHDKGDL